MRWKVKTCIITEWTAIFEADTEQGARDKAYAEVERDIPPDGYVEQTASLVKEDEAS